MPIKKNKEENLQVLIKDIMTMKIETVTADTPLLEASEKMVAGWFNGLPVVDKDHKVIGIITEYDLLTKGTAIHIPTFIRLMGEFPAKNRRKDLLFKESLRELVYFTVGDVMNKDPIIMWENATLSNILRVFSEHHRVNPIPIVDAKSKLVGIVSRFDVVKYFSKFLREFNSK